MMEGSYIFHKTPQASYGQENDFHIIGIGGDPKINLPCITALA